MSHLVVEGVATLSDVFVDLASPGLRIGAGIGGGAVDDLLQICLGDIHRLDDTVLEPFDDSNDPLTQRPRLRLHRGVPVRVRINQFGIWHRARVARMRSLVRRVVLSEM